MEMQQHTVNVPNKAGKQASTTYTMYF